MANNNAKKVLKNYRGAIPPQLLRELGNVDISDATREFVDYMNAVAGDFIAQAGYADEQFVEPEDVDLYTPQLFGMPVKVKYIGSGTIGAVYKMEIAGHVFSFKIIRATYGDDETRAIDMYPRARNLIKRPYIGGGMLGYSWILSDWVPDEHVSDFNRGMEKIFLAGITKGVYYNDAYTDGNIIDGKIVDYGGLYRRTSKLTRVELDNVKRLVNLMKRGDMVGFDALCRVVAASHPRVINHMFVQMSFLMRECPERFQPFKDLVAKYNNEIKSRVMQNQGSAR